MRETTPASAKAGERPGDGAGITERLVERRHPPGRYRGEEILEVRRKNKSFSHVRLGIVNDRTTFLERRAALGYRRFSKNENRYPALNSFKLPRRGADDTVAMTRTFPQAEVFVTPISKEHVASQHELGNAQDVCERLEIWYMRHHDFA